MPERGPERDREEVAIHAPLAGGDPFGAASLCGRPGLRSTPPSREATTLLLAFGADPQLRSTPPSREATTRCPPPVALSRLRSTPPSREATRYCYPKGYGFVLRSTPPSREATRSQVETSVDTTLRSTPPSREATMARAGRRKSFPVAIHAPLAGGDPDTSNVVARRTIDGEVREPRRPSAWRVYRSRQADAQVLSGPPSAVSARSSREMHESCRFARPETSSDKRVLEVDRRTHAMVLHSAMPTTPQHIETQTILRGVDEIQEI